MPKRARGYRLNDLYHPGTYEVPSDPGRPVLYREGKTLADELRPVEGATRAEAEARVRAAYFELGRELVAGAVDALGLPNGAPRVRFDLSFSPAVARSKGGLRRGPMVKLAGVRFVPAAAFDAEQGEPEYASFDADPVIGGVVGHWRDVLRMVVAHEVAHVIQHNACTPSGPADPLYGIVGDVLPSVEKLRASHGMGWRWVYANLRAALVNDRITPATYDKARRRVVPTRPLAVAASPRCSIERTGRTKPAEAVPAKPRASSRTRTERAATTSVRGDRYRLAVAANPKRPGSAARTRFDAALVAATDGEFDLADALARGYTRADLKHDLGKGFVEPVERG